MKIAIQMICASMLVLCMGASGPECSSSLPGEGEQCGEDINTTCVEGLYCAYGFCGTPPRIGICLAMGACIWEFNCMDEHNQWNHVDCVGEAVCKQGMCQWICKEDEVCKHDSDCPSGQVCELSGPFCGPNFVCVNGCRKDADCGPGQTCNQVKCVTCPCPAICEDH